MSIAGSAEAAFCFGRFTLDHHRGALLAEDGAEVPLRAKSYALLSHLVQHAGRLVERDELMTSVWPDVTVTDDSITQCVRDVRRALGDDGGHFIRTVPKRGYVFVADLTAVPRLTNPLPPDAALAKSLPSLAPASTPMRQRFHRARSAFTLAAAMALILGAGAVWQAAVVDSTHSAEAAAGAAATAALPPQAVRTEEPPLPPRERAVRLYREGYGWALHDTKPAALLGQRDLYQQAIAADPTYAPAWTSLVFTYTNLISFGRSLNRAADLRLAEQAAERAIVLAPQSSGANAALGSVLRLQPDRLEEALAAYRKAVELSADAHSSRANIGYLLVLLGRPDEAEPYVRTSLAAAPPEDIWRSRWHFYLGLIDLHLAYGDHGVADFRRALALCGQCGENYALHLAAALAHIGQITEARVLVDEVRKRKPELTAAFVRTQEVQSRHAIYLAQRERFLDGLVLAGLPE